MSEIGWSAVVIPVWCTGVAVFVGTCLACVAVVAHLARRYARMKGRGVRMEQRRDGTWERIEHDRRDSL